MKQNRTILLRFYRNRVNEGRKLVKAKYYHAKLKDLKDTEPKKWRSECKRLCGMSKSNKDIVSKLFPGESPCNLRSYKVNLANDINSVFLEPQQGYTQLSSTYKLDTTGHEIPTVTTESIAKQLSLVSVSKASGPDNIPNWIIKDFSHILASPICSIINYLLKKNNCHIHGKALILHPYLRIHQSKISIKDLRPISLTSTTSEIAEDYVVREHVKPVVLRHIRPEQYGCIPQSSTTYTV